MRVYYIPNRNSDTSGCLKKDLIICSLWHGDRTMHFYQSVWAYSWHWLYIQSLFVQKEYHSSSRPPISPAERLAVTLHCLVTGKSQVNQYCYVFKIIFSFQSSGVIVIQLLDRLFHCVWYCQRDMQSVVGCASSKVCTSSFISKPVVCSKPPI